MCDLKAKYDEWRKWLSGNDKHAIDNQIRTMIWDSAVFLSINETRNYAPLDGDGKPANNGMVHRFINHCFFVTQAIAIRRLLDRNISQGERSVISLFRLLCDMQSHRRLLTREGILSVLGYPYDYKSVEERILQEMAGEQGGGRMPDEYEVFWFSEQMHEYIDAMTNVSPGNRKPDDTIPDGLFVWLKTRLNSCKEICDYVDKHFAHSATPESREVIKADEINVTLGHILDAHKVVCEITHFITLNFFYYSHSSFLATPQYDQFKFIDKPLATPVNFTNLRKFWKEYDTQVKQYDQWDWKSDYNDTLTGEIEV